MNKVYYGMAAGALVAALGMGQLISDMRANYNSQSDRDLFASITVLIGACAIAGSEEIRRNHLEEIAVGEIR